MIMYGKKEIQRNRTENKTRESGREKGKNKTT
jgi:hypothetical protein